MRTAASGCTLTWSPNRMAATQRHGTSTPFVIRPSRDADVDAMLAIYRHHIRRGIEDGVDDTGTPRAGRSARPAQEPAQPPLAASGRDAAAARSSAMPMRCCSASDRPIATRPSTRSTSTTPIGRGIGRLLIRELIDVCAAAGFRQMIGYIDADNAASLRLHERFGFARVGLAAGGRLSIRPLGRHRHGAALALAAGATAPPPPASLSRG